MPTYCASPFMGVSIGEARGLVASVRGSLVVDYRAADLHSFAQAWHGDCWSLRPGLPP